MCLLLYIACKNKFPSSLSTQIFGHNNQSMLYWGCLAGKNNKFRLDNKSVKRKLLRVVAVSETICLYVQEWPECI